MCATKHRWLNYVENLRVEADQAREEGKETADLEAEIVLIEALDRDGPEREERAGRLLDMTATLPIREGYPFVEPSDIEAIHAERPTSRFPVSTIPTGATLFDKLYGAWLGRSAGCLLGQPVEGWKRERLIGFMKDTNNYPFNYYMSSDISPELIEKYNIVNEARVYGGNCVNWINNVKHMVEDDDLNYTIIGLVILERYGYEFTQGSVAEAWLMNLPILHVCTAERVAYKNIINSIDPPKSGSYRNVYREWIGAQIRADFFGYANPGNTEKAAEMAWRDASISHVKNGIYGEMWVAAMLAAAAVTDDIERIVEAGLAEVPKHSRLAGHISEVISWKREGVNWEQAIDRIHERFDEYNEHHWCHTLSNAMIVTVGLLYGDLDFERSIGIAVSAAFDTDCNGATVGSIVGMILGVTALPNKWIEPLNDTIKSGVDGFGLVKISELSKRSVAIAEGNPYVKL